MKKEGRRGESPTIPDIIQSIHTAADMILVGKQVSTEALTKYPFIIDADTFSELLWDNTNFGNVRPEVRNKIAANAGFVYEAMARRAALQERWSDNIDLVKENIVFKLTGRDSRQLGIDPKEIEIAWGLFSFELVAKSNAFKILLSEFGDKRLKDTTGFVSGELVGPLGPIPVVLAGGRDVKKTLIHEDIHVFQAILGQSPQPFNFHAEIQKPFVDRALANENILPEDLEECRNLFYGVCANSHTEVEIELRTYLWERRIPIIKLDGAETNDVTVSMLLLENALYSPAAKLSEADQMKEVFMALYELSELSSFRLNLFNIVKNGISQQKNTSDSWKWAASRVLAIPVPSSLKMYKAVLCGRDAEIDLLQPDITIPLAEIMIMQARRTINPQSYGQGEIIPINEIDNFVTILNRLFLDKSFLSELASGVGASSLDYLNIKKKLVEYARKSVSAGQKGKIERLLTSMLVV